MALADAAATEAQLQATGDWKQFLDSVDNPPNEESMAKRVEVASAAEAAGSRAELATPSRQYVGGGDIVALVGTTASLSARLAKPAAIDGEGSPRAAASQLASEEKQQVEHGLQQLQQELQQQQRQQQR